MDIRLLTSSNDLAAWDSWAKAHPHGSLWQSREWQTYQAKLGRETRVYAAMRDNRMEAAALVIIDRTSFGFSTWDIPRGPLAVQSDQLSAVSMLLKKITADAKKDKCLSLYLSPAHKLKTNGWKLKASPRTEQPEATLMLDLTLSDDDLLAQMHQKGRYNIKVAQKNGVRVEQSSDIGAYAALAKQTAARDHYKAAPAHQYEAFLAHLPGSFLLLAYAPTIQTPIAGLLGVCWPSSTKSSECGRQAGIYYYGASDYAHRALMAPYLLQWEAIQLCREAGCTQYDLLGIAPPGADDDHPWHGITSFKEKFGGTLVTYPPEQRIVLRTVANAALQAKRALFG